jgi:hypothetical protein
MIRRQASWRCPTKARASGTDGTSQRGEFDHLSPSVLPDNQAVVFTIKTSASRDDSSIGLYDRKTGEYRILLKGGSQPQIRSRRAS